MLKLDSLRPGLYVHGLIPDQAVRIISTEPIGLDAVTVYFKAAEGPPREQLLTRADEERLEAADNTRPWSFTGDGQSFVLTTEAQRIRLAHLFDPMMAVHTSDVEPLPHQITAVYESMLPRQPLRFVLADDPGAGKTIMAGLLISELTMRADAQRVLIVAPGSLVEQWQDELRQKFGLDFILFNRDLVQQSASGNAFNDHDRLIARLDQLSRNDEYRALLEASHWDLIVVDEAHKMAAHWSGNKINPTGRFELGQLLGRRTRHFLLMTATPHNGKEEDFQLFMSLLDTERFYGRFRDGAHQVDVADLMRRMVKEELRTFDNRPLFPERKPYTIKYELSPAEKALYEAVSTYVREEMDKADKLDGRRKSVAGFALTSLQRRLASSPGSIFRSLNRRRERLEARLKEEQQRHANVDDTLISDFLFSLPDDPEDDYTAEELEEAEAQASTRASAARTLRELAAEVELLKVLEEQARRLRDSGQDCKWEKLSEMLQSEPLMKDSQNRQRKLIIFTEYRDTLLYLQERIQGLLGDAASVVCIDGSTARDKRLLIQDQFRQDERVRVLLATDAAGEGVNLQNAHLMVNYDLPWNPNRLEQRFGRIHRIGQTEVCHLWNLVAQETREGQVFNQLLTKIEQISLTLNGRVFDVLGEVFEGRSLRDMLIEAIRDGDRPEVRNRLQQQMADALDIDHLKAVIERNALCQEVFGLDRLQIVREQMEKAEARKLQPYFVRQFVQNAFKRLGGELRERETNRYKIPHVPAALRDFDRRLGSSDRRLVLPSYERVCFEKSLVRPIGQPQADLLHPGHPLVRALTGLTIQQGQAVLQQGALLLDPSDDGRQPRLLFLLEHVVREGSPGGPELSKRLQFVWVAPNGSTSFAGWAPHLELEPLASEVLPQLAGVLRQPWLDRVDLPQLALTYAVNHLAHDHFSEVKIQREAYVDKTRNAVHQRLTRELMFWDDSMVKAKRDLAAGKPAAAANLENARRTHEDLDNRYRQRMTELAQQRHIVADTPRIIAGALVLPAGLVADLTGHASYAAFAANAEARRRTELVAMQAVRAAEKLLGHDTKDVSADKCGWDITAYLPLSGVLLPAERHLEVKGLGADNTTVILTRNEILYALNQREKFVLVLVRLGAGGEASSIHYVPQPFSAIDAPADGVIHNAYQVNHFLGRSLSPEEYYAKHD
jgi:superfamily II DNA or RNA helicase